MNNILNILKNRRVWVAIISMAIFVAGLFSYNLDVNTEMLADKLVEIGSLISSLVVAGLSLWSYLKPKQI